MIHEIYKGQNSRPIDLRQEKQRLIANDELSNNIGSAACKEIDVELFFELATNKIREAKSICEKCEIIDLCLDFAILNEEMHGIEGGKTSNERFLLHVFKDWVNISLWLFY